MRALQSRMTYRLLETSVFLFLLISCSGFSTNKDTLTPAPIIELSKTTTPAILAPPSTDTPTLLVVTPTPRIFEEPSKCDDPDVKGHILYLRRLESIDLYIMDGNACSQHLIMQDVSGSPDWSADGKRISIGCDDNKFICILDASKTLDSCLNSSDPNSKCTPVVIRKYALPVKGEQTQVYNTSWSYDGTQIVVEYGDLSCDLCYVDILTLSGSGTWKTLTESFARKNPDMSPVKNEILFDGIFVMPLDGSPIRFYISGWDGAWSHDGKKIAVLVNNYWDENKENTAIWEWNFTAEQHWRFLYEPPNVDRHYWPPQNLRIGDDSGQYKVLSWSLDGRFIAFVAGRTMNDNQIFRLDTNTGDVVILTTKFNEDKQHYHPTGFYYAPAWGP